MSDTEFLARIPRGIRNNNPGNIREPRGDSTHWLGERATDDDPTFEEFETMEEGVRALAKLLLTYRRKYHLDTVRRLISRWAPPSENNTAAYVRYVGDRMRVDPDRPVNLAIPDRFCDLVAAIIDRENGFRPDGTPWVSSPVIMAGVLKACE